MVRTASAPAFPDRWRSPRRVAIAVLATGVGVLAALTYAGRGPPPAVVPPAGVASPELHEEVRFGGFDDGPLVLGAYASPEGYEPLPPPVAGDWRSGPGRSERLQTFPAYRAANPVRATAERTTIVLQPLGDIDAAWTETFERVRRYSHAFFGCPVELAAPVALPTAKVRERSERAKRWRQHHTITIMDEVLLPHLPAHAICYLGVTLEDLYPEPGWNYVFGQAYLARRAGVYSLARYQPQFWGEPDSPAARRLALLRALKVLAHETGHMFGLEHCLHFACCMNGSNNLSESDRQPLWYCPVCDSKLTWNRGFDPIARFRAIARELREFGLDAEATWYEARLVALEHKAKKP